MEMKEFMATHGIENNYLFSQAKLGDKIGMLFFKPGIEKDEETGEEYNTLEPDCIIIDDAKFLVTDDTAPDLTIYTYSGNVVLIRIDGLEIPIGQEEMDNSLFKFEPFVATQLTKMVPTENGMVEIKN